MTTSHFHERRTPQAQQTMTWRVRMVAKWRSEELPVPLDHTAFAAAWAEGVRLCSSAGELIASFDVDAPTLRSADRHAHARWSDLVRDPKLTKWRLGALSVVSLVVDEVSGEDRPARQLTPQNRDFFARSS
jgi:hypothetical protein